MVEEENQTPGSRDIPDNEFRVVLARRGQHWVSAVRVGNDITVDDVAIADSASIASLVMDGLESIHHAEPAAINAVNVPLEEMLEATKSWQESGFNVFSGGDLRRMGISAATVAALGQALSDPAAEVAVYARQYQDDAKGPSTSVLSLKDGSGGRIAMYQQARTAGSGRRGWPSARPPLSWFRWASRLCWTRCPTASGNLTAESDLVAKHNVNQCFCA